MRYVLVEIRNLLVGRIHTLLRTLVNFGHRREHSGERIAGERAGRIIFGREFLI